LNKTNVNNDQYGINKIPGILNPKTMFTPIKTFKYNSYSRALQKLNQCVQTLGLVKHDYHVAINAKYCAELIEIDGDFLLIIEKWLEPEEKKILDLIRDLENKNFKRKLTEYFNENYLTSN